MKITNRNTSQAKYTDNDETMYNNVCMNKINEWMNQPTNKNWTEKKRQNSNAFITHCASAS